MAKQTSRRGRDKAESNAVGRPRTKLEDTSAALDVLLTASAAISVTVIEKLPNSLIVSSTQVAADTTPGTYHFAAPLNFTAIVASPTTALTTQTLSATIIRHAPSESNE